MQLEEVAGGVFWVEATELVDGRVQLRSTALAGEGREALEVVVSVTGDDGALFRGLVVGDKMPKPGKNRGG